MSQSGSLRGIGGSRSASVPVVLRDVLRRAGAVVSLPLQSSSRWGHCHLAHLDCQPIQGRFEQAPTSGRRVLARQPRPTTSPRALLAAKNAIQRPSVALLTGKQGLSTPPALAAGYLFDLREPGQCAPGRERQLRSVSQAQRRRKGPRTVNSQRRAAALVSRDPQRPRPDPGIKKSSWATLVGPHTSGVVFCGLIREET